VIEKKVGDPTSAMVSTVLLGGDGRVQSGAPKRTHAPFWAVDWDAKGVSVKREGKSGHHFAGGFLYGECAGLDIYGCIWNASGSQGNWFRRVFVFDPKRTTRRSSRAGQRQVKIRTAGIGTHSVIREIWGATTAWG